MAGSRPRDSQRERWRDCPRPPPRIFGLAHSHVARVGIAQAWWGFRACRDLHRRGPRTSRGGGSVTALVLPHYPELAGGHSSLDAPDYVGTRLRNPLHTPFDIPQRLTEIPGPLLGEGRLGEFDRDLTRQHEGEPLGQRIIVHGRVIDDGGKPLPATLIEVWQANAGGRYRHVVDNWPSPIDPNFTGLGRTLTDEQGRYEFTTIKPGAYPWRNNPNAWRPAHIHFSLFGRAFTQRLITQ